jgi:hypothetical protein
MELGNGRVIKLSHPLISWLMNVMNVKRHPTFYFASFHVKFKEISCFILTSIYLCPCISTV